MLFYLSLSWDKNDDLRLLKANTISGNLEEVLKINKEISTLGKEKYKGGLLYKDVIIYYWKLEEKNLEENVRNLTLINSFFERPGEEFKFDKTEIPFVDNQKYRKEIEPIYSYYDIDRNLIIYKDGKTVGKYVPWEREDIKRFREKIKELVLRIVGEINRI